MAEERFRNHLPRAALIDARVIIAFVAGLILGALFTSISPSGHSLQPGASAEVAK